MTEPPLPDDEIDVELRSPAEIAGRLIVLASLLRRAYLEEARDRDETTDELFDLRHWLHETDMLRHATGDERRLIEARPGLLTEEETADIALESESLAALGWSVGLAGGMPPYNQFASPTALLEVIPQPWDPPAPFADGLIPRSDAAIATERERAELWLWRTEIEADRQASRGQERAALDAAIRETAQEAAASGSIEISDTGDFLLDGTPFRDSPAETREAVALIAGRRLHALNWLCGFGDDWDHVPLDI
jgi:hypothetical protein